MVSRLIWIHDKSCPSFRPQIIVVKVRRVCGHIYIGRGPRLSISIGKYHEEVIRQETNRDEMK